ncbi:unnamed protein product [Chrysoparadoxa australica]
MMKRALGAVRSCLVSSKSIRLISNLAGRLVEDDSLVKWKHLRTVSPYHKQKNRKREGKVLLEGDRLLIDALEARGSLIPEVVMVTPEALDRHGQRLVSLLEGLPPDVVTLGSADALASVSLTKNHQGALAVLPCKPELPWPATPSCCVVLDGVSQPGNLGALIRTGAALGADSIVLIACGDVWSPKALKASLGASFRIPIAKADTWQEAKKTLIQNHSLKVYAADGAAATEVADVDFTVPFALVIGSEANGLSHEVRSDIGIDAVGVGLVLASGVDSLNAAAAGMSDWLTKLTRPDLTSSPPGHPPRGCYPWRSQSAA